MFPRIIRIVAPSACLLALVGAGCNAQPAAGVCAQHSYAAGGAHTVVCPGTSTCSCAAPSACCMAGAASNLGECVDPQTCGSFLVTCDGPEDCGGGVCCLTAAGSSCTAAANCGGSWLCRMDSQCASNPAGQNCNPADYGIMGVKDKGLDGLVGVCGQ
jgi:hypothetical protein